MGRSADADALGMGAGADVGAAAEARVTTELTSKARAAAPKWKARRPLLGCRGVRSDNGSDSVRGQSGFFMVLAEKTKPG